MLPVLLTLSGLALADGAPDAPADGSAVVPAAASPVPYWEGEIAPGRVSATLDNGLQISVVSDPTLPLVATQIWVHVGGAHELPEERGFAHLFEHMMFGDTENVPKSEYARMHTTHGGGENAYTSWDETVYISEIAPEAHAEVLKLEADRFEHLAFTQENLANEQKIVTEELRLRTENDPISRLFITALAGIFGDHPYSKTPAGTHEDIAGVQLSRAKQFYEDYYRPGNLHLVVAGPVDGPRTLAYIEDVFGPIPAGGKSPPEVPLLTQATLPEHVSLSEDLPPVEIAAWVYTLPESNHADTRAIEVMLYLLNGGQVDLVRQALVTQRGKALEAGSAGVQLRSGGIFAVFSAELPYRREKKAQRLIGQTVDELSELAWLTDDSLATAKRSLLRTELSGRYSAADQAGAVGAALWHLGDESRAATAAQEIQAVTRDEVARVWGQWVAQGTPTRVYIKPDSVPLLIRAFGWLAPVFGM